MNKQYRILALAWLSLVVLSGCASSPRFKQVALFDDNQPIKPSSIAVVAGTYKDQDVKLAEYITKELTDRSTFRTLSQEYVAVRTKGRPATIEYQRDVIVKVGEEKVVWFLPSERAKLDAIQRHLKVNYLFVVWIRGVEFSRANYVKVYPIGNVIEYPSGRVLVSVQMGTLVTISPLAMFRAKDYYFLKAFEKSAISIVDQLLDLTASGGRE